jgi:hypothetical protein
VTVRHAKSSARRTHPQPCRDVLDQHRTGSLAEGLAVGMGLKHLVVVVGDLGADAFRAQDGHGNPLSGDAPPAWAVP